MVLASLPVSFALGTSAPESVWELHLACCREWVWRLRRRPFAHRLLESFLLHAPGKQRNSKWLLNAIGSAKPPDMHAFHIAVKN